MGRNRCKVDDAIEEYGLGVPGSGPGSLDGYLVDRWTGADDRGAVGYRTLAEWFNRHLLGRVYDEHGRRTTGVRVESEYEALTGDDDIRREEVVADLESDGIDAESVVDDMVSPRTMHRHLTGCLGAEKEASGARTDWERASVERAREQLEEKVAEASRSLASKGELRGADAAEVEITIYLACPECATRVPFEAGRHRGYVCEEHSADPPGATAAAGGSADPADARSGPVVEAVAQFSM